ncbi:MAG: OmpA family protein [Bacteroidota bacterium]|nr:OmpA family protein [Bacteroidota bacterium]
MQRILTIIVVLSASWLFQSCGSGKNLEVANEAFEKNQFGQAVEAYKIAYSSVDRDDKKEIAFKIAEGYRQIDDYRNAEKWYSKAIQMGYTDPQAYWWLAYVLKMNEEYELALIELENYKREMPSAEGVDKEIAFLHEVIYDMKNPGCRFTVESFRVANSAGRDYAPVLHEKDGLYFTSDREESTGKKTYQRSTVKGSSGVDFSDIFLLKKIKKGKLEKWDEPAIVEGLNTEYNDGTVTFDDRGNEVYFTQCNGSEGKVHNCNILSAQRRGSAWGNVDTLPFCNDTSVNYGHPTLSPDNNKMIFVINHKDDLRKQDLYISTYVKRGKTWSDPIPLGEVINTSGREMYPYFFNDTTLYFASDGHPTYGGLDIYVTYGSGTTWTKPKNLKAPINSGGDDFSIFFNKEKTGGYFASNRPGSRLDDIYEFKMNPLIFTVTGTVYDTTESPTKPLAGAVVELTNLNTETVQTVTTDASGKYFFKLNENVPYMVMAGKPRYENSREHQFGTVGYNCSKDTIIDINIGRFKPVIEIKGILYDLDKWTLRPESIRVLDSLVEIMETYPYIVIELGSHTDCRASFSYNDTLSQKRADTVVTYLIAHGIDRERLVPKGYGERDLVNHCACEPNDTGPGVKCTEEEHQLNRRTTFRILRFDYEPKND